MDRTEEKVMNIDELKRLLKEVNYIDIIFTDPTEWNKDQQEAMDSLLQYTNSKPKFDYSKEEDADNFSESIDGYLFEIISSIPEDQRADFYKSINQDNIGLFFSEDFIRDCPEVYTLFMSNFFGDEKYKEMFSEDFAENFEFLKDCPELIESLDTFPVRNGIPVLEYLGFINNLVSNVYAKIPEKNKGKAVLSYFRNTVSGKSRFFNLRLDIAEEFISDDFKFSEQDFDVIVNDLDGMIDNSNIDYDFYNTVVGHLSDELKNKLANYILDRAHKAFKEQNDEDLIKLYDNILSKTLTDTYISSIQNPDEVLNFLINSNLGRSLKNALSGCTQEDTIKYFEEFITSDSVMGSKNGVVNAFVSNLDFEKYKISADDLTTTTNYIVKNCDYDSLESLLEKCPKGFKQPIVNFVLQMQDRIPDIKDLIKGKPDFIRIAVEASRENAISGLDAWKTLCYAIGFDKDSEKSYVASSKDIIENFSRVDISRRMIIKSILPKIEKEEQLKLFNCMLYIPYVLTQNEDFSYRSTYINYLGEWLNVLPSDVIEKFLIESSYAKDRFVQLAYLKPDEYSNINEAIGNISEKIEYPDMSDYDQRIQNGDIFNQEEMEEFCRKVELIRLKDGIIPEQYCDFAIKNTIMTKGKEYDSESDFYRMFPLFLVDKTIYILNDEGIEDVNVYADTNKKGNLGSYIDATKELCLSVEMIMLMQDGVFDVINTIFHETQHAIQSKDIKSNNLQNPSEYSMIKEQIVRENDFFFYKGNYRAITAEIDARIAGRQKMYKYLQSLGIPVEQILEGDVEYNVKAKKSYEEYLQEEVEELENQNKEFSVGSFEKKSLDTIFDEIIAKNPEIIEKNPLLKYEYNKDGSRKCSMEILQEYEEYIENGGDCNSHFILQEYLIQKDFYGDPEAYKAMIHQDAEILRNFMPRTERGKALIGYVTTRIANYAMDILNQMDEARRNGDMDKWNELLKESNEISSAVSTYLDRKMSQDLLDLVKIDSMVTDEQRADALSQMQQVKDERKKDEKQQSQTIKASQYNHIIDLDGNSENDHTDIGE